MKPMLYSFVRFRPYFESGEFVNVALLMCEPNERRLTYRLVDKDNKIIDDFFYNTHIFAQHWNMINKELDYIVNQKFDFSREEMIRFFHNYVDCSEGILQYSHARGGLVDDPQQYFDELYAKYIEREGSIKADELC